ncbi:sensor histidine kinase [Metabacillus endolithicus]|uniref:histidine kinase n=1 Tax=Metabacillus endolithicus TaxID=1535204 RepID=A0ABW5C0R1_9BACI|nr:sensor histidine kinase [Metabacillus endolithicus]UPG65234.1 sensor histidine kinase [Metabacillus endolithicus]
MFLTFYLRERIPYILNTLLTIGIVTLIAGLSLREQQNSLDVSDIFYMIVISLFFLSITIIIDYSRQRAFLKRLYTQSQNTSFSYQSVEALRAAGPASIQQKLWITLLENVHEQYMNDLDRYQHAQSQHFHFTNQWVHHMKTPVSVISLLIQEGKNEHSLSKDVLLDIEEENERFRHGLDMMLHVARLDHFSVDLQAKKIDLVSMLRQVINQEKRQFIKRKLYPTLITSHDEIFVYSDEKWIFVVFHQILINALKYSPQYENKTITIEINKEDDQSIVSISDEGIGIPDHDLKRIFDPFFTGENGRIQKEATGMGLYLVKEICQHLGHQINVTSSVGKGTTFSIHFTSKTLHSNMTNL